MLFLIAVVNYFKKCEVERIKLPTTEAYISVNIKMKVQAYKIFNFHLAGQL